jgi:hypothetical protein
VAIPMSAATPSALNPFPVLLVLIAPPIVFTPLLGHARNIARRLQSPFDTLRSYGEASGSALSAGGPIFGLSAFPTIRLPERRIANRALITNGRKFVSSLCGYVKQKKLHLIEAGHGACHKSPSSIACPVDSSVMFRRGFGLTPHSGPASQREVGQL